MTVGKTSGGITHGGGAVDLVPAAEDEAGFSVIHPADRQIDEEKSDKPIEGSFAGIVERYIYIMTRCSAWLNANVPQPRLKRFTAS